MTNYLLVGFACAASLIASSAFAFDMPIMTLASNGEAYQGTIHAKLDRTSTFELTGTNIDVTCTGATDKKGIGVLNCTNGRNLPLAIQGYGKLNGAYVETYGDVKVAIVWGKRAKADQLPALLQ